MSHERIPRYNALIRRGIDDRELYRRALSQVREPGLQALLSENLHTLDALIGDLQAQVGAGIGAKGKHVAIPQFNSEIGLQLVSQMSDEPPGGIDVSVHGASAQSGGGYNRICLRRQRSLGNH